MTTSKTIMATPYRNQRFEEEAVNQNPNATESNPETADQTAGTTEATTATSDLTTDDNTYMHRWKNLKKYHDTEIHSARNRIKELEDKLEAKTKITPPKTKEELDEFRQDNPDLYDMVLSVSQLQAQQFSESGASRLAALERELADARADKALTEIQAKHPDMINILESAEFDTWLKGQDAYIQAMVNDNESNAAAMIRALDLYKYDTSMSSVTPSTQKESNATVPSRPQNSAADAVSVTGGGTVVADSNERIWTTEEIRRMRNDEFEAMEAEIMQAYAEGRVQ